MHKVLLIYRLITKLDLDLTHPQKLAQDEGLRGTPSTYLTNVGYLTHSRTPRINTLSMKYLWGPTSMREALIP